ncbi:MAG: energy transducer TonB [Gemmatimonadales bacterium]
MRRLLLFVAAVSIAACSGDARNTAGRDANAAPPRDEPPVALDPVPPVTYPADLYQQGVEGTVQLRLFVNETGTVLPESTAVVESSGYPAFDSAAVRGVARMRFAPAQRDGRPVATAFAQPVHFRRSTGQRATP